MKNDLVDVAVGPHLTPHISHLTRYLIIRSGILVQRSQKPQLPLSLLLPRATRGRGRGGGTWRRWTRSPKLWEIFLCWDIYVFFANCGHGEGDFQNSEKNIFECWFDFLGHMCCLQILTTKITLKMFLCAKDRARSRCRRQAGRWSG